MAYKKEYSKVGKKYTTEKKPAYKPKRGPLSKLMSEDEKASAGIHPLWGQAPKLTPGARPQD
jgi:hypothetical protein